MVWEAKVEELFGIIIKVSIENNIILMDISNVNSSEAGQLEKS